jgi:two-component system phosphate regulon response regulator PhoB
VDSSTGEAGTLSVLVVSDDPLVREDARYGFPAGVDVSFALDARDAADALRESTPSVVVVDMQTGNAGGYALARYMAESEALSRVPTLILLQRSQDAWLAARSGATACRTKPLQPGQLAREVLALERPKH